MDEKEKSPLSDLAAIVGANAPTDDAHSIVAQRILQTLQGEPGGPNQAAIAISSEDLLSWYRDATPQAVESTLRRRIDLPVMRRIVDRLRQQQDAGGNPNNRIAITRQELLSWYADVARTEQVSPAQLEQLISGGDPTTGWDVTGAHRIRSHSPTDGAPAPRQGVLMITVVWGEWYLKAHLELNLPTLLADRNLPSFCATTDMTYVIMTRLSDVDTIRKSPSFQALTRLLKVEIRVIAESETANPIAAHQRAWARATDEAKRTGRYVLYMPPDVAWSDGSFQHLARLLAEGNAAIFMTYLRVVSETFVPAARQRLGSSGTTLTLSGRELVALSLQHVHPLMAAHMHDSPYFPVHPEMVVWPVAGEGVAIRCLAREMFLFDPNRIDISQQLLVGGGFDRSMLMFIDDSDDLYAVSLAPLGKDVDWHKSPGPADLMAVARWWLTYDSPVNDVIASSCLRWHHDDIAPSRWSRIERASGLWIKRMMALREGMRVWRALIERRSWSAAALMALVLRTLILPRALKDGAGLAAMIFVPAEDVLRHMEMSSAPAFRDAKGLIETLRRHVVFESTPMATTIEDRLARGGKLMLRTAAGEELPVVREGTDIRVAGHRVIGHGQRVGRHLLYMIDGIVGPPVARELAAASD